MHRTLIYGGPRANIHAEPIEVSDPVAHFGIRYYEDMSSALSRAARLMQRLFERHTELGPTTLPIFLEEFNRPFDGLSLSREKTFGEPAGVIVEQA